MFWIEMRKFWAGLVCLSLVLVDVASATPVTLQFQGEITNIENIGNPSVVLPADIIVGQSTTLELTFVPIPFPDAAKTTGPFISPGGNTVIDDSIFYLSLGSVVLSDSAARIFVDHDPFAPSTATGPSSIEERELIDIRGDGVLSLQNEYPWQTDGGFANIGSLLDGGELLSDPSTWNIMPLRVLAISFSGPSDGLLRITTSFGNAAVIPEPKSLVLVLCFMTLIALGRIPLLRQASH